MKKRLPMIFIYLVLVSFVVSIASFSRYTIIGTGSDSAKVAPVAFDYVAISATFNGAPLFINGNTPALNITNAQPGSVLVYNFQIRNYKGTAVSMVKLKYSLGVNFDPATPAIPLTYSLVPNGSYPSAGGGWYYLNQGSQATHSYTLTVNWDANNNQGTYVMQSQTVLIKVDAQQADS